MLLIACHVTLFVEGRSVAAATPPVSFFKKRIALEATPQDLSRAMADQHQQAMQAQSHNQQQVLEQYQQQVRQTSQPVFSAVQNLWFESRRVQKRGPPSTAGFSSTGLASPQHEAGDTATDAPMSDAQPATGSAEPATPLFQPLHYDDSSSLALTAAQVGVDPNNREALESWLDERIETRRSVFETVRAYHVGVIRGELYNLISQVEGVIKSLDDRLLQQQQDLFWLTSECRTEQKRVSGLQVLLTGWDPKMNPEERHFMIHWMMQQVEFFRAWLNRRGVTDLDPEQVFYNVLQVDPATPPSGSQWSTITILTFKAWDLRREFMSAFGGATGTALWKDAQTPVKGRHIRATPCSPQFQRKLELPLRVLLSLINESAVLEHSQVVVLWKTLTIMTPQQVREFDAQATACARLFYFEKDGVFQARLEIGPPLHDACEATPPAGAEEPNMWAYSWNKVVFGVQSELDAADRSQMSAAVQLSHSGGPGAKYGQSTKRWTNNFVYSSAQNPYPLEINVVKVSQVAYCWDEYADKLDPSKKVGDYKAATYKGAPILAPQACTTSMGAPTWVPSRGSNPKAPPTVAPGS